MYTAGAGYSSKLSCSHGITSVYKIEGITFYGATVQHVNQMDLEDNTLVVNCGTYNEIVHNPYKKVPAGMKLPGVDLQERNISELWLTWDDFKKPCLNADTWVKLYSEAERMKIKHILFTCSGGHGRTGTALASILIATCGQRAREAILYVRKEYCDQAVETFTQEEYLCDLAHTLHGGELENPNDWKPKYIAPTKSSTASASTSKVNKDCKYCNQPIEDDGDEFDSCFTCWKDKVYLKGDMSDVEPDDFFELPEMGNG